MSLLDCFAALAMTDAVVFADINAAQAIVNKLSSTNHRQQAIVSKLSVTNHRHCEYPFRTATKKCKDACQETSQTASEHATYKKRHCKCSDEAIQFWTTKINVVITASLAPHFQFSIRLQTIDKK
jgi:hypothetical protein